MNEVGVVEETKKTGKVKKVACVTIFAILVIIIIFLCCLLTKKDEPNVTGNKEPVVEAPKIQTGEYIEEEEVVEEPVDSTQIYCPVITDIEVSKSDPYITLFSPEQNKGNYLLKYTFTDKATDTVLYESDYLEGGFKYSVDLGGTLDVGVYDVNVALSTKDAKTYADKNGTVVGIKISVTE